MKEQQSMDEQDSHHPIQTVTLVVLESLLTFLLHNDASSHQVAHGLIARQAVVEVRTYFPAQTFYATFSDKGVLLDFEKPEHQAVDGLVTASMPDMVRAFLSAPEHILSKIRVDGDEALTEALRQLMGSFNLSTIMRGWWRQLWSSEPVQHEQPKRESQRVKRLLKRVDEQQKQVEALNLQLHEQNFHLRQLQLRYQRLLWVAGVVIVLLGISVLALLFGG